MRDRKEVDVRRQSEAGESLIEIVIALVILGAVVSAMLAAIATSATSSKSHRDLVTADAALRNYAEATKTAVRASCRSSGATYTVAPPPTDFAVSPDPTTPKACPSTTGATVVHLGVTLPSGTTKTMDIEVRSP
jgi:Tfp pilus assembly protein PilV